jgi:site-specific recombinase XerD
MRIQRGVRASTLKTYNRILREFVHNVGDDPTQYDATNIRRFVANRSARNGISTAKNTVTSVRMLLRFAAIRGMCDARLADAVQGVASWKLNELPKHVDAQTVERLIASCDTQTEIGLRDRAMLLLLSRLGLRAGDVAGLCLNAIDWSAGTLRLRGKGCHDRLLPLPQEVGDALLAYLERRKMPSATGKVFLRQRAPVGPFANGNAVSCAVSRAARRAGVSMPAWGAHVLRHTAATLLLRKGVPLDCVSGLLRHNSIETTTIYAKVDTTLLKTIAQPWPMEVQP